MLRAWDRHHDESFHLSQVVQKTLQRCLFPLGSIPRDVVLSIAKSKGIPVEKNKVFLDKDSEKVHRLYALLK